MLAKNIVGNQLINVYGQDSDSVGSKAIKTHPGPIISTDKITKAEMQWNDIGSGTFARTFVQAPRLLTTTRIGPPICDVHRRTIWSLSKGRVIHDCIVDDTPDKELNKILETPDDIRVELIMKDSLSMYLRAGADIAEVYSLPRICQAAAEYNKDGTKLQPGWSLDLTRTDPATGQAWNLADATVQSRVTKLIAETKPLFLIGSPPCTAFSAMQNISKAKRDQRIVAAELEAGRVHLRFCVKLYEMQMREGRFFVHEHPAEAAS